MRLRLPPPSRWWGYLRKTLKGVFFFENLALGLKRAKLEYIEGRNF
jgi:hypothetical protein